MWLSRPNTNIQALSTPAFSTSTVSHRPGRAMAKSLTAWSVQPAGHGAPAATGFGIDQGVDLGTGAGVGVGVDVGVEPGMDVKVGMGVDVGVGVDVVVEVGWEVGVWQGTAAVCVANISAATWVTIASCSACDGPQAAKRAVVKTLIRTNSVCLFILCSPARQTAQRLARQLHWLLHFGEPPSEQQNEVGSTSRWFSIPEPL